MPSWSEGLTDRSTDSAAAPAAADELNSRAVMSAALFWIPSTGRCLDQSCRRMC